VLADSFGRIATDLRVSLTDRCNLRCSYCMPPEGLDWLPSPARVGIIGSVTRPFCGACDRVRLTADGQIRNCLFANDESDLRTLLRAGADDDQLAAIWRRAVAAKLPGHGINDHGFLQPTRPMSAIGG
jgi:molybdenum cofactor biosynthesis enzyme MoaA